MSGEDKSKAHKDGEEEEELTGFGEYVVVNASFGIVEVADEVNGDGERGSGKEHPGAMSEEPCVWNKEEVWS